MWYILIKYITAIKENYYFQLELKGEAFDILRLVIFIVQCFRILDAVSIIKGALNNNSIQCQLFVITFLNSFLSQTSLEITQEADFR